MKKVTSILCVTALPFHSFSAGAQTSRSGQYHDYLRWSVAAFNSRHPDMVIPDGTYRLRA
ncbi:MAG: hypothetical protein LUE26_09045 [Alistipes sp.]|nr:hypothetical protein [Alistipes sp.]